jgi:hypothetical protein
MFFLVYISIFIQDDIYVFFTKRYSTIDEITFNAVYDFFTSLTTYKNEYKVRDLLNL